MTAQLTEQEVFEQLKAELVRIHAEGAQDATMDSTWKELDVDSLDLVELVQALEERYGIRVEDDKLEPVKTVGDAVRLTLSLAPGS